jgi:glycosidase
MCKWLNEEMNSQTEMTFYKSIIFSQQVRNCRLSGLLDLALEKDYVRTKVADYMNHLIDIGVAGFRLDAAKHMWPGDIKAVWTNCIISIQNGSPKEADLSFSKR